MGFELPEVGLLYNTPEEIEAAHRYAMRHAPDLLPMLGLGAPPPADEKPTFAGEDFCTNGHRYTEASTIWRKNRRGELKRRQCRVCKNDSARGVKTPADTDWKEPQ